MSSAASLRALHTFLKRTNNLSVLVASHSDDDLPALHRLTLHQDVAADFLETATAAVPNRDDDTILRSYDPGYKPDSHELCFLELAETPLIRDMLTHTGQVDAAPLFEGQDVVVDGLRYYAIVVQGTRNRSATFFRAYSPKKELSRHAAYALMLRKGAYNRVRSKIFLFDEKIDCFAWDGTLYIANVTQFQRIFGYFEQLRAKAEHTIRQVSRRVPIANLDEFRTACVANQNMLAKLAVIAGKPYLSRVGMQDIRRTIEEFELPIATTTENGREKLVFEPHRERRWLILKLLDDDYLGSVMTRERYEVNSKVRL